MIELMFENTVDITIAKPSEIGYYLYNRGRIIHRGLDIYTPKGKIILAPEPLRVLRVGRWTSPEEKKYWNNTLYVLVQTESKNILNFAELDEAVDEGSKLDQGNKIGTIGQVLNPEFVDNDSPQYIHQLLEYGNHSMLHFERYIANFLKTKEYNQKKLGTKVPLDLFDNPIEYLGIT
jgi:hypothetical protein